jgi:hypothetical protein
MNPNRNPKPWYFRRRYWTAAVLLLLVYFCLLPMPLRVSPETTGITEPLLPNGMPDYFAVLEKTWTDKLSPPEDNGQRLMIAACGPRILEQAAIAANKWEEIPAHEHGKIWFEKQWIPMCKAMGIDPYAKPKFYDSLEFFGMLQKEKLIEAKKELQFFDTLIAAPCKQGGHPKIDQWLVQRSPVLDLFGVAVRKANFVCWREHPADGNCTCILLPDVQANRSFIRDLRVRIAYRLGLGDIDGAWYDTMSMFYLARKHYYKELFIVTNLVGIACERYAVGAAQLILKYGQPSKEQLARFTKDLSELSRIRHFDLRGEQLLTYDSLCQIRYGGWKAYKEITGEKPALLFRSALFLPVDWNIAGKRITQLYRSSSDQIPVTPALNQSSHWFSLFFIRSRSRLIADSVLDVSVKQKPLDNALCELNARLEIFYLALALERYRSEAGTYPDNLEALVPQYFDDIPLDPFTSRKTLTYKVKPEPGTAYILYSYGLNGLDDGGKDDYTQGDIVFKR